ncbi:MAG: hypothetical protein JO043_10565 [Candidatus Eremiobacteraeota bacterium]|nr:hypothetical protein [Candidatus Eremiobacteraeota bacterium]
MPLAQTASSVHAAVVVDRREPAPGIVVLGLRVPSLEESVRPGQFAMVAMPSGEQAAVALAIYEAGAQHLSLMIVVVGTRTAALANLAIGERIEMLAPLGNGFEAETLGDDVALVAGGVGIASLLLLAAAVVRRGARACLYYGARAAGALVESDRFARLGIEVSNATDDGSRGYRGFVTELFAAEGRRHSGIAGCGPTPMLRRLAEVASQRRIPAQLSLEEPFGCGVGACWGCVIPHAADENGAPQNLIGATRNLPSLAVGHRRTTQRKDERFTYVRVCREGPVFWSEELRW